MYGGYWWERGRSIKPKISIWMEEREEGFFFFFHFGKSMPSPSLWNIIRTNHLRRVFSPSRKINPIGELYSDILIKLEVFRSSTSFRLLNECNESKVISWNFKNVVSISNDWKKIYYVSRKMKTSSMLLHLHIQSLHEASANFHF